MSGKGINADGDAGLLPTPACQVHRDHPIVRQPPSNTVPLVKHDGALEVPEWATYYHLSVCQGGRTEETTTVGKVDSGERVESLSSLQKTS